MIIVDRYDSSAALIGGKIERTPQGGFRAPARFTRSGVLSYTLPDGTIRREWRPPEEVFSKESVATLHDATVTIRHPKGGSVTPENYKRVSVGHVRDDTEPEDDTYLSGTVVVQDGEAVDDSLIRALSDISPGYRARLELTSGIVPDGLPDAGQSYDVIQRDIKYNHVALLPRGKGRAGSDVGLRLDSSGHQVAPIPYEDSNKMELSPEEMKLITAALPAILKMAGASAESAAPAEAAPVAPLAPEQPKTDEEPVEDKDKSPAIPPAPKKEEEEEEEERNDQADQSTPDPVKSLTPEETERLIQDSVDIRERGKAVFGENRAFGNMSNRQVMTDVILHVDSKFEPGGKPLKSLSDDALRATFEMALGRHSERADSKGELAKVRRVVSRADSADEKPTGINVALSKKSAAAYVQ